MSRRLNTLYIKFQITDYNVAHPGLSSELLTTTLLIQVYKVQDY